MNKHILVVGQKDFRKGITGKYKGWTMICKDNVEAAIEVLLQQAIDLVICPEGLEKAEANKIRKISQLIGDELVFIKTADPLLTEAQITKAIEQYKTRQQTQYIITDDVFKKTNQNIFVQ